MPVLSATPISATPISCTPIAARAVGAAEQTWAEAMVASLRRRYLSMGDWLDSNPGVETELLARMQPGEYLYETFGPPGQNKTECDFLLVLQATGDITAGGTVTKTGDALRWDIDGTVTTQNNLPAHTLGAGDGVITVSSTDGWSGLTELNWEGRNIGGDISGFSALTSLSLMYLNSTDVSGDISGFSALTSLTFLRGLGTSVSGDISGFSALTSLTYMDFRDTSVSGDISGFSALTSLQTMYLSNTSVSGDISGFSALTSLQTLNLADTSVSGDISGFSALTSLLFLRVNDTSVTYEASGTANWANIRDIRVNNCSWDQVTVDRMIADIYAKWDANTYTYATPTLNIGGSNAAPSGVYADEDPPTTGLGMIYEMVEDPESTGYNTWTITYTSP